MSANPVIVLYMEVPPEFLKLLRDVMEKNGWGVREVARRASLSHTLISNIVNLGEQPSFDTCVALAPVLEKSPLTLIYLAGLLPKPPDWKPELGEAVDLFARMDETEQDDLLAYMRRRAERGQSEKSRT